MIIDKIRLLFISIPDTTSIENKRAGLNKEYNDLNAFASSDELEHYEQLRDFVLSDEFKHRKEGIKAQKFKDTEEYKKLQRYNNLKKKPDIKIYLKVANSQLLNEFNQIEKSDKLKELNELEQYVNSNEFAQQKSNTSKKEFVQTEAYQKEQKFKQLVKDPSIKKYFKFKESNKYKTYIDVKNTEEIKEYYELEAFINSEEFKKVKEYMGMSPKKKFEQSEEYENLQEYLKLKNSDKIKWFYRFNGHAKFDEIRKWDVSFEDDFESSKLDAQKWLTKYYWADKMLNETYSVSTDKHLVTDGKNLEIGNSNLSIITKKEQTQGQGWHPKHGFHKTLFEYTSGLINNGHKFRQKNGLFETKIKINNSDITHAFWLITEQILPQINIFKFQNGKLELGHFWRDDTNKKKVGKQLLKINASKFVNNYFIFSLEWYPEKIIWKINEKVILTQKKAIPDQPMYLNLSSGVYNGVSEVSLPATMDIDWVKCYRSTEAG
jgi:hypothetical protein